MNSNSFKRTANLLLRRHRTLLVGRFGSHHRIASSSSSNNMPCSSSFLENQHLCVRGLSTTVTSTITTNNTTRTNTSTSSSSSSSSNLPTETTNWLPRRGPDDAIVTVTVGDKEFKTLKSTLRLSPVIWDAVMSAERNQKHNNNNNNSTTSSTTTTNVFLDRDPKHFPIILAYLRNKVDEVSYNRECESWKKYTKYIQIPKNADLSDLEDLYLEATYYQLNDLQIQLAHGTFMVRAWNVLNGSTTSTSTTTMINPFERTKEFVTTLRNVSLTLGGMGTATWAYLADTTNSVTTMAQSLMG